uniref:Lamin Tail Domain n=1 Tax=Candidatus Kentrum sp. LPFa TaxID=2126335 RepID=A0A450VW06_9GAMM|nr:MAG: Lamin Tail Domain [Candidatus Kentron sp. LPFa]VFK33531.1 MAG: Lamin Tail Domain [Candidatus Kentron sp. LPFa]
MKTMFIFLCLSVSIALGLFSSVFADEECSSYKIVINELQARKPDWVELYNPNGFKVDLGGYKVYDRNEYEIAYTFPPGTIVESTGYFVQIAHANTTDFAIRKNGETIYLWDACGKLIDKLEMPRVPKGYSFGIDADGRYSVMLQSRGRQNY